MKITKTIKHMTGISLYICLKDFCGIFISFVAYRLKALLHERCEYSAPRIVIKNRIASMQTLYQKDIYESTSRSNYWLY